MIYLKPYFVTFFSHLSVCYPVNFTNTFLWAFGYNNHEAQLASMRFALKNLISDYNTLAINLRYFQEKGFFSRFFDVDVEVILTNKLFDKLVDILLLEKQLNQLELLKTQEALDCLQHISTGTFAFCAVGILGWTTLKWLPFLIKTNEFLPVLETTKLVFSVVNTINIPT